MDSRVACVLIALGISWLVLAAEGRRIANRSESLIPARRITSVMDAVPLAEALQKIRTETSLEVMADTELLKYSVSLPRSGMTVWLALQEIAKQTSSRIQLEQQGQAIRLKPRQNLAALDSVTGPFRVVVQQIDCRHLFETGITVTDLTLDIHWEPWLPVIRLDAQPQQLKVSDDRGSQVIAQTAPGKVAPFGALHRTTVRLLGVPRAATRLTSVEGAFTVTAAPTWLAFEFSRIPVTGGDGEPGTLPPGIDSSGVSARLLRFEKFEDFWEAEIRLDYPPGHPEFESFESWTAGNRVRLFRADQGISIPASDPEISERGRIATGIYRFPRAKAPQGLRDARLIVETPAALREFAVSFRLENIPLP